MSVLFILVILSVLVASTFLVAFIWSVRSDQFNDQKGSAMRILQDNDTDQ